MTVYLGTLGRMIPIYSTPSAQLETEDRYSFSTTLEGRRKAQQRPIGRRTWGLNAQFADPSEHSLLSQFANGAWGPGPFVFVSVDAQNTNMLTPDVASCDPLVPNAAGVEAGGPMLLPDNSWSPRSYLRPGPGLFLFGNTRSPVLPGVPVSVAVTVLGDGAIARISWYTVGPDSNLALIGHSRSTVTGLAGAPVRSHVTAVPPPGAVGCIVGVENGVQVTQPSMVWGDSVPEQWSDGQGCAKAVVSSFGRDQVLAVRGNTFSNVSFTVTEVG